MDSPQGLDPSLALDNIQPPSAALLADNLADKGDYQQKQPYEDRQLSHEGVHAPSLTHGSNDISTAPPNRHLPTTLTHSSSHRRSHTEVISRPDVLSARGKEGEEYQCKTAEDVDAYSCKSDSTPQTTPTKTRIGEGAKRLSDWFQGKSDPVALGIVRPSSPEATAEDMAFRGASASPTRTPKRVSSPLKQVTTPNRFSFFGFKRQEGPPEPADDELLNLDVNAALFPAGSDELSDQEAFNALRDNAGTVIKRLQAAYKERTFALHEANADKNAKQEELEETRTRVGSLKVQLDGMAEKVQQQEQAIKAMAEELEQEKQLRQREDESRRQSVMLVRPPEDDAVSEISGVEMSMSSGSNTRRSSKRASTFTSDSGFDSGDDCSVAESVFSRKDGGGVASPTSTVALSPNLSQVALFPPTSNSNTINSALQPNNRKESKPSSTTTTPTQTTTTTTTSQRSSAYDRVMKGLASTTSSWMATDPSKCTVCHGVPSTEAWSVLGVLKEENRGLKTRLGELEVVIEDCLGLVGP